MLKETKEYNHGKWVKKRSGNEGEHIVRIRHSSERAKERRCAKRELDILSYMWEPSKCKMPPFKALLNDDLIARLKKLSPVLFAGDSLLEQFYSSFADYVNDTEVKVTFSKNFLLVDPYSLKPVDANSYEECLEQNTLCPKGLNEFTNATSYHRALKYFAWGQSLHKGNYNTLILNTGHHWWKESTSNSIGYKNGTDAFEKYPTMVKNVAKFLNFVKFKGYVIYVTSPPGFSGCKSDLLPNSEPVSWKDTYSWKRPSQVETYWEKMFQKYSPNIKFLVLNITGLSVTRGDAHPGTHDCLHYCQIGVPDEWSRALLLQLFQIIERDSLM